jgi:hypothetical protein
MIRTRLAFLPHPIHTNKTTTKIKKIPNAGSSNSLRRPIKPKSLLISVATTTQPVREREYTPLSDFQFLPLFIYLFICFADSFISSRYFNISKKKSVLFVFLFSALFLFLYIYCLFAYFLSSAFIIFP